MLLRIAGEAKGLPCIMVYIDVRKSEGNRDYNNVCSVMANKGESIPNLAMRLRQLSAQELCSEVIVNSLSSFPEGTVFACWDLQMTELGLNKVSVARY